jgi:hypothetical protein
VFSRTEPPQRSATVENVIPAFQNVCAGSLKTGKLWLLNDLEQVECLVCGKLLEPGYANSSPRTSPRRLRS